MVDIVVRVMNGNVPAPGLADDPEITIRRTDTGAVVLASGAMTDRGDGLYTRAFVPVRGLAYGFVIDADPNVTGQVPSSTRHYDGAFDSELDDIWNDRGLNPSVDKTITENIPGAKYTEAAGAVTKSITKVGVVTTIDSA